MIMKMKVTFKRNKDYYGYDGDDHGDKYDRSGN